MPSSPPLYLQISEDKLRAVIREFYDRVFSDVMIGYLFKGKDKERLIEKEFELLMLTLGAPVKYTGRSMTSAHMGLKIMRGMFDRRVQIMKETMEAHGLPEEVRKKVLSHSESLRETIVNVGKECAEGPARKTPKKPAKEGIEE